MMGGQTSKKSGGDASPLPFPIVADMKYTADLSSYEAACQSDPDLQSCDATTHDRINRVLNTLTVGVDIGALSFDALMEVTECLMDVNQDVMKVIQACREDIMKDKDMFHLVNDYFECSLNALDFCTALENCLRKTCNSQLLIKLAVKCFEEEMGRNGKYEKTLEELRRFKAAGDPFTEEFVTLFQSVYKQQMLMFKNLQAQKRKIDKRLKSLKTWKKVLNVIFIAAFASVLIFSVVAAAVAAPPVVAALAAAVAIPVAPVGKWCNTLWNRYINAVKRKREIVGPMEGRTFVLLRDFENVRAVVMRLEIEINALIQKADLALRGEGAVKVVMDDLQKKIEVFEEAVEKLKNHAGRCSKDIAMARSSVLETIIRPPNS